MVNLIILLILKHFFSRVDLNSPLISEAQFVEYLINMGGELRRWGSNLISLL